MSFFHDIIEGYQTTTHRVRLFRQVLLTSTKIALALSIMYFMYLMSQVPSVNYLALVYQTKAELLKPLNIKISVSQDFWWKVARQQFFGKESVEVSFQSLMSVTEPLTDYLLHISYKNFYRALTLFASCYFFIFLFFGLSGRLGK